jgi:hypothetical protein
MADQRPAPQVAVVDTSTVSTAVCTVRRVRDHLELEPVVPGAGALLSEGSAV